MTGFAAAVIATAMRALKSVLQVQRRRPSCPRADTPSRKQGSVAPAAFSSRGGGACSTARMAQCTDSFLMPQHKAPAANPSLKLCSSAANLSTDTWNMFGRQGMLLTDTSEKLDSMNLLKYMAPVASLALIPAVIVLEPNIVRCVAHMEAYTAHLGNSTLT